MPVLDYCINALFEPGYIGASSGLPPVIVRPSIVIGMVTARPGAYKLTGTAASIVKLASPPVAHQLIPDAGSYILTGTAASILASSPPLDGLSPTAAWSASRKLLTAYGGSFYNLTTGRVDTLYDQSGNARDLTQGTGASRPVIDTSTAAAALDFAGSQQLARTASVSSFISATDGYMIATVRNDTFQTDNPGSPYNNAYVLQDNGQNCGLTVSNNSGSPLYYVGSDPNYLSKSIAAGTVYVVEWRHEGGTLYQRTNGTGETSMTAGNTNVSGSSFRMGAGSFDGLIYEAATFSSVPTLSQRNALVQALGLWAGASV